MRLSLAVAALLALGASAAEPCTLVVTARVGDTCASLSEVSGITVSQFLRANPGVTTCSTLVSGTKYCVDPNYVVTTSRAPAATNKPGGGASPLDVTKDGQCGNGLTCLGSAYGDCCSEHGWCGSSADHCGPQCQAAFGKCASSGGGSSAPTGGNAAVTVTAYVTTTITAPGFATTTQIVRQTVSVTVPVTVKENNGIATATSTTLVTQSSLIFISSTVTTIRTITITDAKQCTGRSVNDPVMGPSAPPLGVAAREARVTGVAAVPTEVAMPEEAPMYPSPTQPGTVPHCQTFYRIKHNDSCDGIVRRHRGVFDMEQLYSWNQQLTGDCQGLWLGHWICVGA